MALLLRIVAGECASTCLAQSVEKALERRDVAEQRNDP
jgi:hypothetical protein